jgi:hypothetical protein
MSSFSARRLRAEGAGAWLQQIAGRDRVRMLMLGALPLAILAASPQRVALSALIAAAYVGAAAVTMRRASLPRTTLAYVAVVAALMVASWLRARYLLHLQPDQLDYATSMAAYFVLIVLPMAAAVAVLVDIPEAIRPVAAIQLAIGSAVALLTVLLLGDRFLGADRYSWQGDLIALAAVIAVQPWPVRSLFASAVLGALGVAGVMMAGSRQALTAMVAAMVLSALFWAAARYLRGGGAMLARLRLAVTDAYVALPVVLVLLAAGWFAATLAGDVNLHLFGWSSGGGGAGGATSANCHCVTDRFVSLGNSAGGRDLLLRRGVHLFLSSPLVGTGLGSFAGAVPDTQHPGFFYPYPHNLPLEIAAAMGVVGLVVILGPLLAGWALLLWRGVKTASAPIATLMVVVAVFLVVANVSGDIPSDRGLWIFGVAALRLGLDSIRRRQEKPTLARAA